MSDAAPLDSRLRLLTIVYDHRGQEIGKVGMRERDQAFGMCRRVAEGATEYDAVSPFLTMAEMQRLAFQVLAGNPLALKKSETAPALAAGFIAQLAAIGAGFQQQGDSDAAPAA